MKRIITISLLMLQINFVFAQLNMSLLGQLPYSGKGNTSDIWGYVDEMGNEYALVGLETGVSIVDVTNPSSPNEVFWTSGISTIWRDLKTYNDKVYVTNDYGGNGLKIIDLAPLPGNTNLTVTNYTGSTYPFQTAHNLYIDENGYCYLFGAKNGGVDIGTVILNLNLSPIDPNFEVGVYNDYDLHDGMVYGDTLWGAAIYEGFFVVVNVLDKTNPITMASKSTPSNFAHNCWVSDDSQILFTTDEKSNGYIASYDVSDLGNITELDRIQSSPGQNVIPHNTHFINNYLVTSYYRDGVIIHDVSNPNVMVQVGNYDTAPSLSGDGGGGCWGVYPWLPSGNLIASDINNGLFVLGVNYIRASYIEGTVIDSITTAPIDGVTIQITGENVSTNTNINGYYTAGISNAGNYTLTYAKPGYFTKTFNNVPFVSGFTNLANVELTPFPSYNFSGKVLESGTMNPIPNVIIHIKDSLSDILSTTDALGNFAINNLMLGNYDITVGKWGNNTQCFNYAAEQDTTNFIVLLDQGYYDDFSLDFNWMVTGDATSGMWEKGIPIGLTIGSNNVTPNSDVNLDCGSEAFITGNSGQSGGQDDIVGGSTIITSPVFDATLYANPYVQFEHWFYNGFGSSQDDKMLFKLSNGITEVLLGQVDVNSPGKSTWVNKIYQISNFITPTNNMKFIVSIGDLGNVNVTEGGFDMFEIKDVPLGIKETSDDINIEIYPNPFNEYLNIEFDLEEVKIEIIDITGRLMNVYNAENIYKVQLENKYKKGIYFIKIFSNGKLIKTQKVVKF